MMDDLTNSVNSIVMSSDDTSSSSTCSTSTNLINSSTSYYYTNNYINLASNRHPKLAGGYHQQLYKSNKLGIVNQEERRQLILIEQKKKRQSLVETKRLEKATDKSTSPNDPSKKHFVYSQYVNQLMFSEWLEEIPTDFQTNWIVAICPIGKRCLVVAKDGNTFAFNKAGKLIAKHFSKLPGGSKESRAGLNLMNETILDCVYNDFQRTYYVLDCICWKNHPIVDSEAEFRFYWLQCKLEECQGLDSFSSGNPYIFQNMPRLNGPLNSQTIRSFLHKPFEKFEVDGALFYHKEGHYVPGFTPLVGWLKLYMIPDILNIELPFAWIRSKAPSDYYDGNSSTTARDFIRDSNKQIDSFKNFLEKATKKNSQDELDEEGYNEEENMTPNDSSMEVNGNILQ